MYKWFKGFLTVTDKHYSINKVAEVEREKAKSISNAKNFAEDLDSDVRVLKQFFDITPKIGSFGSTVRNEDITVLTLRDDFVPGVKMQFYVGIDGIAGFEFTKVEE